MITPVFLSYIITFVIPGSAVILTFIAKQESDVSTRIIIIMYTINHANNFVIFAAANQNFRKEIKKVFGRIRRVYHKVETYCHYIKA